MLQVAISTSTNQLSKSALDISMIDKPKTEWKYLCPPISTKNMISSPCVCLILCYSCRDSESTLVDDLHCSLHTSPEGVRNCHLHVEAPAFRVVGRLLFLEIVNVFCLCEFDKVMCKLRTNISNTQQHMFCSYEVLQISGEALHKRLLTCCFYVWPDHFQLPMCGHENVPCQFRLA